MSKGRCSELGCEGLQGSLAGGGAVQVLAGNRWPGPLYGSAAHVFCCFLTCKLLKSAMQVCCRHTSLPEDAYVV
jgi:hypothetical protein